MSRLAFPQLAGVVLGILLAHGAAGQALSLPPASLPNGTVGVPYTAPITATGGTSPYSWSITSCTPTGCSGLALSASNTLTVNLTGTPTTVGAVSVTVSITDSSTPTPQSATQTFSVTINPVPLSLPAASLPNGVVGVPYTAPITATGGTSPYSWSITSCTPTGCSGLALSASNTLTVNLTGTPTTVGAVSVTVSITDSSAPTPQSATQTFSVTINPAPLTITTTALPSGVVNAAYSATLQATGGITPYTWSAPGLPSWLTLNTATGALTGTPTVPGIYHFSVQVTDSGLPTPQSVSKPLSVNVASGLTVVTTSLANAAAGAAYSQTLSASGGTGPYSWTLASGLLPPGLTLASTGQITGTPTAAGTYSFTVQVADASAATASKTLSITVAASLTIATSSPLPDGLVGRAYSLMLTASGGTPPYSNWQVVSGSLPSGLSLSAAHGLITGTPTAAGSSTFIVQVFDSAYLSATKVFTLTVSSPITITTTSLPGGATGAVYSQVLTASGGTPPYTWAVASGALPPGLSLTPSTGAISGTPTQSGSFSFSIRVTDSASATATQSFVLAIAEGLSITAPAQLPGGTVGSSYSTTLTASGGKTPYAWSVTGTLPPGLALTSSTGVISGTPTTAGNYSLVLQVTDGSTPPASATKGVTLAIVAALTITTSAQLPAGTVGTAYSQTLTASGGTAPYSWSVLQSPLPAGLSLSSSTGALTGTPTTAGFFSFTIQVTDSAGRKTTQEFSLTIATGLVIATESSLPAGTVGVSYSQSLAAAGGTPPYTEWRVISGILPSGLSLDASTGRLTGTPTAPGILPFTIQVKDSTGRTATKEFTLTIQAPPLLISTASSLPAGFVGRAYSQTLAASGGTSPYTWAVTEGTLPAGLTLEASTGHISGTPTTLGTSNFTVAVTDNARKAATKSFSLTIGPPALPSVQIFGLADNAEPAQQPNVRLTLAAGYPLPMTGRLTLSFEPDAVNPSDDPTVLFSTGGRAVTFTIAANATEAVFPTPSLALQTGTVAGAITLRATFQADGNDITPSPAPAKVSRVLRSVPVIRSVQVENKTSSSFDVVIKGFSTPRQITQATFRFTPAPGASLQTTEISLPMTQLADAWFQGQESRQYGSQFTLRQAFTVQGDMRAIGSVSVTLTNSIGTSSGVSAGL